MATPSIRCCSAVSALFAADEVTEPFTQLPWYAAIAAGVLIVLFSCAFLVLMLKNFPRGRRLDSGENRPDTQDQGHHKKKQTGESWPPLEIDEPKKPRQF
jgi:hypothetical protein